MSKNYKKWTYDDCWQIATEFTTLKDFRLKSLPAYAAALRRGWIKDYTWLKVCNNHGYWDYDKCYEEAKKYITVTDFAKGCGSGHHRACKNDWIKDYTWFVDGRQLYGQKHKKWNYDACYELAKQCSTKTEMNHKNGSAYRVALKNGWLPDYTWFLSDDVIRHRKRPSRVKWPYEKCKEIALQYNKLRDFQKAYPSVYTISKRNGWIDDFDWLSRSVNAYTSKIDNVYAYFFNEFNSVYIGRTINPSSRDLGHNTNDQSTVFRFASKNNTVIPKMTILESGLTIIEGLDREDYYRNKYQNEGWNVLNIAKTGKKSGSIGGLGSGKWNYKSCYKEAQKYNTLKEFRKNSAATYHVVLKNGWLNDYKWLKTVTNKANYWTYEMCYKEAQLYKTRTQFQKENRAAYNKALKENWLDDYVWFTSPLSVFRWDYDKCYEEAKKYTNFSDFRKKSGGAYNVSRKNNWIEEYTWLNKKDISQKPVLQFSLDGKFIAEYKGVREAARQTKIPTNNIGSCCRHTTKSGSGFIWRYKEED